MLRLRQKIGSGQLDQARTVAFAEGQADAEEDLPETRCPACGKWIPDLDGFGVLAHTGPDGCGYCSHPSRTGRTCDICGHVETEAQPMNPEPIRAAHERFRHLDGLLRAAALDEDAMHKTASALWLAVCEALTPPPAGARGATERKPGQ